MCIRDRDDTVDLGNLRGGKKSDDDSDDGFWWKLGVIAALISFALVGWVLWSRHNNAQKAAEELQKPTRMKKAPAPDGWYAAVDDVSGRAFFHHTVTKERCWRDPRNRDARREYFIQNLPE
eukprot:TRINITY_DN8458_c0_g1_i1.p1 TRINITY_DN8458_c0_g1~~TRINITY_DN8458_c0_g1_i1.p1  ORF type:complete len:121 (+),score=27.85 TRINITY_DN8458_c0_g1_i1:96-458(+)